MDALLAKYLFYYPVTLIKGELVALHIGKYRNNQHIKREVFKTQQQEQAIKLLSFAHKWSPYYSNALSSFFNALQSGQQFEEAFRHIPFLTKQDIIEKSDQIATWLKHFSSEKTTGGSTGEPVRLLKNTDALARERAATLRAYEWAGIGIGEPQARFWGVPHGSHQRIKSKIVDFVSNRIRLSAFDLNERTLDEYYSRLQSFRPAYLYGYVSVINEFAKYLIDNNLSPITSIKAVITTSEVLTEQVRTNIFNAFGVKTFNEYGCGEVGSIAHECERGSLHVMADNLIVETEDGSATGELVVTDLFNSSMPLIRYKIGDFGTLSGEGCKCGRTLPVIEGIHGRAYDLLVTETGKKIHPEAVMYVFEDLQGKSTMFKQFQVVQLDIQNLLIKIIPDSNWQDSIKSVIAENLRNIIQPNLNIEFEITKSIAREASGKMRVVKSNVS